MYYQIAFVPGGQPIGALENVYGKLAKRMKKLFGRKKPNGVADPSETEDPVLAA